MLATYQQNQQQQAAQQAHTAASNGSYHAGLDAPALTSAAKALLGAHIQQIKGLESTDRAKLLRIIHNLQTLDGRSDLAAAAAAVPATLDHNACPSESDVELQSADDGVPVCKDSTSKMTQGVKLPAAAAADDASQAAAAAAGDRGVLKTAGNSQKPAMLHRSMSCQETGTGPSLLHNEEFLLPTSLSAEIPSWSAPPPQQQQQQRSAIGPGHTCVAKAQLPAAAAAAANTAAAMPDAHCGLAGTGITLPNFIADLIPTAAAAANAGTMQHCELPPGAINASAKPPRLQLPRLLPPSVAFGAAADQQQWQRQQQQPAAAMLSTAWLFDGAAAARYDNTEYDSAHVNDRVMTEMQHLEITDDVLLEFAQEFMKEVDEQQQLAEQYTCMHFHGELPVMHALPTTAAAADYSCIDSNALCSALGDMFGANAPGAAVDGSCIDSNAFRSAFADLTAADAPAAETGHAAQGDLLPWQQLRQDSALSTNAAAATVAAAGDADDHRHQCQLLPASSPAGAAAALMGTTAMEVDPACSADANCPAAAAANASELDVTAEIVRYARVITCKTYLKRLNITQAMADDLLPCYTTQDSSGATHCQPPPAAAAAAADGWDAFAPGSGTSKSSSSSSSSYELLFRDVITLVDEVEGAKYKIQYEGVMCNNQKHLRFTSGWREYAKSAELQVGDTLILESRGNIRHTLYVSILRAGSSIPDLDDSQQQLLLWQQQQQLAGDSHELPNKKRKLTRRQAVQRLA